MLCLKGRTRYEVLMVGVDRVSLQVFPARLKVGSVFPFVYFLTF